MDPYYQQIFLFMETSLIFIKVLKMDWSMDHFIHLIFLHMIDSKVWAMYEVESNRRDCLIDFLCIFLVTYLEQDMPSQGHQEVLDSSKLKD